MTQQYMNLLFQLNFVHNTIQYVDKLDRDRYNWLLFSTNKCDVYPHSRVYIVVTKKSSHFLNKAIFTISDLVL
jgi:hypothetical protein